MSESNKITVDAYEKSIEDYVKGTPQSSSERVKEWLNQGLDGLDLNSQILELGSAFGREARYVESLGYKVERTDVVQGFVELLQKEDPSAHLLNAIEDPIVGTYELIFANAVLLHFNRDETRLVLKKLLGALSDNGRIAISVKEGSGEEWLTAKISVPRFFCYWKKDEFEALLYDVGFSKVSIDINEDDSETPWLMVVAYK